MNPIARKLFCTLLTLIAFVFFLGSVVQSAKMCQVCHHGQTITIACDQVAKYLKNHPGDTNGPCPVSQEQP